MSQVMARNRTCPPIDCHARLLAETSENTPCLLEVRNVVHLAVEPDRSGFWSGSKGIDQPLGMRELGVRRGEAAVNRLDLTRMDCDPSDETVATGRLTACCEAV
jgi:hypothetical protein